MNRALRRHYAERAKKRVRGYYGGYAKHMPDHLGKIARTRQLCSCMWCGNPRRHFGKRTLQELRTESKEVE